MANVKISELTAITSSDDLADADIIPLVDSSDSTTKRAALSVLNVLILVVAVPAFGVQAQI